MHYQPVVELDDVGDCRIRGADALAPSGARLGPAKLLHRVSRAERPHPRARSLRAARGDGRGVVLGVGTTRRTSAVHLDQPLGAPVLRPQPDPDDRSGALVQRPPAGHSSSSRSPRAWRCSTSPRHSRRCSTSTASASASPSTTSVPGYSSLSYLAMLHPRIIKIDQSFVRPARETRSERPAARDDHLPRREARHDHARRRHRDARPARPASAVWLRARSGLPLLAGGAGCRRARPSRVRVLRPGAAAQLTSRTLGHCDRWRIARWAFDPLGTTGRRSSPTRSRKGSDGSASGPRSPAPVHTPAAMSSSASTGLRAACHTTACESYSDIDHSLSTGWYRNTSRGAPSLPTPLTRVPAHVTPCIRCPRRRGPAGRQRRRRAGRRQRPPRRSSPFGSVRAAGSSSTRR